ncbi:thiol:disulfide interchange protein DsbD [Rhizobium binae]|uniref:Thiol:disulfide interchange protein DsbD n=1 Tax=Rhizobium binae TaxID=1138190 RepID=A0ABV2MS84_9HYPH|nr:protein-disulfide reductase DsbD [Rhizobium binae]MBX4994790.1 protein-disulfide reductase DsbD [Rhizobium binae]NKL52647.1 protein-disulfide reductase DsbD [Rhizobium leguminosarum bv. viciae]QSY85320.1 protein-disulfide reductase DsbD [Rhizobium binae]
MRLVVIIFLCIFGVSPALAAETPLAMNDAFKFSVDRTPSGAIHLRWQMPPGYYLYRQYLSAKTVDGSSVPLITFPGTEKIDPNFGKSEVYFDRAEAELGPVGSSVTVTYQGCQEHGLCYPPARRIVDPTTLAVSEQPVFSPPTGGQSAWSDTATTGSATGTQESSQLTSIVASANEEDIVGGFLSRGGVPLLLTAFVCFGILLAFTPCVFPLYPILAATLAREGEKLNARRGFVLSGSYAIGLASAFAILGAAAAWTGENLQIALQSPVTVAAVALIFALLALSMFGLFELQLPSAWVARLSRSDRRRGGSVGSAAVLGFSSAFIIGPCVTAPLAGALLYVARTEDIALGAALLFALGLGKGVPLVIFGTVGSQALPRAGAWMTSVKHVFGFVFFAFAIWMAEPVLPQWLPLGLWAIWAMAIAVFLGAFDVTKGRASPLRMGLQSVGLLAAVYAMVLVVGFAAGSADPLRPLEGFGGARTVARVDPEAQNDLPYLEVATGSRNSMWRVQPVRRALSILPPIGA